LQTRDSAVVVAAIRVARHAVSVAVARPRPTAVVILSVVEWLSADAEQVIHWSKRARVRAEPLRPTDPTAA